MKEKHIKLLKEGIKRRFPDVPDEEIERELRKDLKETECLTEKLKREGKIKDVELTSYDIVSVSRHLKEKYDYDISPKEIEAVYKDLNKNYGIKTEEEKANITVGILGAVILIGEAIKVELNRTHKWGTTSYEK